MLLASERSDTVMAIIFPIAIPIGIAILLNRRRLTDWYTALPRAESMWQDHPEWFLKFVTFCGGFLVFLGVYAPLVTFLPRVS